MSTFKIGHTLEFFALLSVSLAWVLNPFVGGIAAIVMLVVLIAAILYRVYSWRGSLRLHLVFFVYLNALMLGVSPKHDWITLLSALIITVIVCAVTVLVLRLIKPYIIVINDKDRKD